MNIKDLKVGDKVFIREDLKNDFRYGGNTFVDEMDKGLLEVSHVSIEGNYIEIGGDSFHAYTPEMIDWEKTIKLRREKMNINDLKVGDVVYIREDLEAYKRYGKRAFVSRMLYGEQEICKVNYDEQIFEIEAEENEKWFSKFDYTPEMIDWEKTRKIREMDFKEIIQYGERRNEITKGVTYGGKEIVAKNNREENDIEKVVMLLMLKSVGITYGDVKKEVEKVKVKWVPQLDEKYYFINKYLEIDWYVWEGHSVDKMLFKRDNCFETRKDAKEKLEKIKEILKGE